MINTTWTALSQVNKDLIPSHYLPWLEKPFILSQALRIVSKEFSVKVISQSLGILNQDEAVLLNAEDTPFALIRETFLLDESTPYVFARVCIPHETFYRSREDFENLGNRPIGETLLYNRDNVTRGEFEVSQLDITTSMFKHITSDFHYSNQIWGRRSLFYIDGNPLLVSEFFLTSIPPYFTEHKAELPTQADVLSSQLNKIAV